MKKEEQKPLMRMIRSTTKVWNNHMKKIALQIGIPDSYRMILMHMDTYQEISQKQLATLCQCTPAAISQIIKEMQQNGYIKKETSEKDGRLVVLQLTKKGQETAKLVKESLEEANEKIANTISKTKKDEMIALLDLITQTIEKDL